MRVEADQVSEVGRLTGGLRGVSDEDAFAAVVGGRQWRAEVFPVANLFRLLVHRQLRDVVRMDENMLIGFDVRATMAEQIEVPLGDGRQSTTVAGDGGTSPHLHPKLGVAASTGAGQEHDFVVAENQLGAATLLQFDQQVEHSTGIGSAIDVVAEQNQAIVRPRLDRLYQASQRFAAAVDITDCDRPHRGSVLLMNGERCEDLKRLSLIPAGVRVGQSCWQHIRQNAASHMLHTTVPEVIGIPEDLLGRSGHQQPAPHLEFHL